MPDSRMPGFGRDTASARRRRLVDAGWLSPQEAEVLAAGPSDPERLSEDVVGQLRLPLSIVPNFRINDQDRLIPMATEEASVVAGAARVGALLRDGTGIRGRPGARRLSAQVLVDDGDAAAWLTRRGDALHRELDAGHPALCAAGGGVEGISARALPAGQVLTLEVRVGDAMGAHAVDRMAEVLGRRWETDHPGGRAVAAIVSNWPVGSPAAVEAEVPVSALARSGRGGDAVAQDILRLCAWASEDPRRLATHLKGTMNGALGVLAAFRQDLRAVDAAVLAGVWCDADGVAAPRWELKGARLCGCVALPIPCGTVGRGQDDPALVLLRRLSGVVRAGDLEVLALSAGLASNLSALQVLVTEGIVAGHGALHGGHATPKGES
jgi:hydroxymethylglutaryl-CoA reductase